MEIPYGYCQCGCGAKTTTQKSSDITKGYLKNEPCRYVIGHGLRRRYGKDAATWRGGIRKMGKRGVMVYAPDHPRASKTYVNEHVLIAERVLGHYLPTDAVIHHIDENPKNNAPGNLVICQDGSYHIILHQRARALRECGHASWRKCSICHQYDAPENLSYVKANQSSRHRECINEANRRRHAAKFR